VTLEVNGVAFGLMPAAHVRGSVCQRVFSRHKLVVLEVFYALILLRAQGEPGVQGRFRRVVATTLDAQGFRRRLW
jgi:hypothetical protein